jgi:large subunit ribosomal protein L1
MDLKEAVKQLRSLEKRKFSQSFDLIINLKGVDPKKENITTIINIPHKIKDKKVCGFLTKKSEIIKTITNLDFAKYKDKKALKNLVKEFDFFIAAAPLMPSVATIFGKVLGPAGKMPSPQLGIIPAENDKVIGETLVRIEKSIKIKVKDAGVKICIGNEKMPDEEVVANAAAVYNGLVNILPIKKENVKNVMIKLTMSKPLKVEVK